MGEESTYSVPAGRLERRLAEKYPPYSRGEAVAESTRCLYCHDAPCIRACPTAIDIPTFIRKIAHGQPRGAARTILDANLLGASCARVCPVEVLCEGSCVYVDWGRKPIEIGRLQRWAMDQGASVDRLLAGKASPTGKSVGLVGAGPASLACAGRLALAGHDVRIYERDDLPGGLNTSGVAPYKMWVEDALAEVEFVRALGVAITDGVAVGTDVSFDELLARHDALFIGVGLGDDSIPSVPGISGSGVTGAVAWIRRMKRDPAASIDGVRRAAVIGGGNTAIDVARELAKLGVPSVRLVYRRTEAEMSGYLHEWKLAKQEGVVMVPQAQVAGIVHRADGGLGAVALVRTEDGKPTTDPLDPLVADLVVLAVGQARLASLVSAIPGLKTDARGRIEVESGTGRTGHQRVWAGGDAVNGGREVVNAVDEGQRAARAIDAWLRSPA